MSPLMRRQFLIEADLLYDIRLRLGEDYVFHAQALLRGVRFMLTAGMLLTPPWAAPPP
jgi:hypothetical protein